MVLDTERWDLIYVFSNMLFDWVKIQRSLKIGNLGALFPANVLASTEKNKVKTSRNNHKKQYNKPRLTHMQNLKNDKHSCTGNTKIP